MMSGKKTLWLGPKQWDIEYSLFRVAEHQVGKLTGHTQEVCGLGMESLIFFASSSPRSLLHCFVFLSPHSSLSHCLVSSSAYSLLLSVWSKDGRTLASGGNDNCVQLWDWQVGDLTKQRQGIRPITHLPANEHYSLSLFRPGRRR